MDIHIYTDGSCIGNPGSGGWAALIKITHNGKNAIEKLQGGEKHTTNNRMELTAVIKAFEFLENHEKLKNIINTCNFFVYSDSSWVIKTMTDGWKRKANLDLWLALEPLIAEKRIQWNWVKGHAGHKENEDCDLRANKEANKLTD